MGTTRRPVPVVAVGASAGGVSALTALIQALPADLPAAVLVVLHVAPTGPSLLPAILSRAGDLPATHASDGERLLPGRVYVAPPDRHLLLDGATLRVTRTAKENGLRPSVDTLFRSVARARGPLAIAAVLSGTLDDGTAGLIAVADAGGRTIAQDPEEAVFPGMPASAVRYAAPHFVVSLADMGALVVKLVSELPDTAEIEEVDPVEAELASGTEQGPPSVFTCPECGGTLFESDTDGLLKFRCRVGHGYSADGLLIEQQAHLEAALYAAVVALEERADLSRRMGRRMEHAGKPRIADRYFGQAEETEHQARVVLNAVNQLSLVPDEQHI